MFDAYAVFEEGMLSSKMEEQEDEAVQNTVSTYTPTHTYGFGSVRLIALSRRRRTMMSTSTWMGTTSRCVWFASRA